MSDNLPTNVQLDTNQNGTVTFQSDVLATIAGLAATEIEGVASMSGSTGLADILSRKTTQTKNLTRGVKVDVESNTVKVDIAIIVDYGFPVPDVAYGIQENVKKAIETMSGMLVSSVDVHVQGLSFEKEKETTAEIAMQQRKLLDKEEQAAEKAEPEEAKAQPEEEDDDEFTLDLGDDADEEQADEK